MRIHAPDPMRICYQTLYLCYCQTINNPRNLRAYFVDVAQTIYAEIPIVILSKQVFLSIPYSL